MSSVDAADPGQPAAAEAGGQTGQPSEQPFQHVVQPSPTRGTAFGLGLAGTILGSIALLWLVAMTAIVLVWAGPASFGWFAYPSDETIGEEGDAESFEPPALAGQLGAPGAEGYSAAELTAAVNEALGDYYGVPVTCPAVPMTMARDLAGRTIACSGTDVDWTFTVLVVFADDQGSFTLAAY